MTVTSAEAGGDLRRIGALFGMLVKGAARYAAILYHPGLTDK
jgi:hypothetical protein